LFREYDLELDAAADQKSWDDDIAGNVSDEEIDPDKIIYFSMMHQALGVNALSEKMGSQNKNIGNNGDGSATSSKYSTERLTEEISGILSIN
jgi:hypothetical protein